MKDRERLRMIRTEEDLKWALKEVDRLGDAEPGSPEADHLEILTILIEKYENDHFPMDTPDPVDMILFTMEQRKLKQKDLIPYIGSASKVSEVLSRKRQINIRMARALHKGLGIPAEVFMKDIEHKVFPEFLETVDGKVEVGGRQFSRNEMNER